MISGVTEKGEQGASATWTKAPSPGSWKASIARSLSARMVSASWTTDAGGRPPSSTERFMEPRVRVTRTPRSRAAAAWMSIASSSPGGNT